MKKERNIKRKSGIRRLVVGMVTLAWILMIAFCFKMTAHSMEKDNADNMKGYYQAMEKEYISHVKSELMKNGYSNAGVMLTNVSYSDGSRLYTLTVNHKKIETDEEMEKLLNSVEWPIDNADLSFKAV